MEKDLIPEDYNFELFEGQIKAVVQAQKEIDANTKKNIDLDQKLKKELAAATTSEEKSIIMEKYIKKFDALEEEAKAQVETKKVN